MNIDSGQEAIRVAGKPAVDSVGSKESLETQKSRLKKATREFESFFVLHMLKAMRQTIPKSGLLEDDLGQDIYTSLFDQELAKNIAGSSPRSLSEILYRSLEKHLVAVESARLPAAEVEGDSANDRAVESDKTETGITEPIIETNSPDTEVKQNDIKTEVFRTAKPKIISDPVLNQYGKTIERVSDTYDVDPRLIYAVIMAESGGQADAISAKGAKGLMQLTDSTAAEMGVADSLDPHQNIAGGARYLRQLLDNYDGDLTLTLAAYNAGPGTVSKYNGVPPYSETRRYIEKVLTRLHNPTQESVNKAMG